MDLNDLWLRVLNELEIQLSKGEFESFAKNLKLVQLNNMDDNHTKAVVSCQSIFHQVQVKKRLVKTVEDLLVRQVGNSVEVELIIDPRVKDRNFQKEAPLFDQQIENNGGVERVLIKIGLKPELSLDNFAVSSTNEMAYAAAQAVAVNPGSAYNPLFLYGGVGVGKTHLMQGVGQSILQKNPDTKVIYCSGEEFTNEIIGAIQNKSTMLFRKRYRSVKLLLIDDIQFIAGKKAVQEEFFHTFNAITKEGGQIIMTSDKPPKEIDSLEDRLRSRFEGGLAIDIGKPDFELRSAILIIKSKQMGVEISSEVAQYVANLIDDTRALLGRLTTIITMAQSQNRPISLEMVQEVLKKLNISTHKQAEVGRQIDPEEIIAVVSDYYKTDKNEVVGKKRIKHLTLPRHVAMYILNIDMGVGLVQIGKYFGNRDHTTVMHAVRKVESLLKNEDSVKVDVGSLRQRLWN